jgi:hypothetical protein
MNLVDGARVILAILLLAGCGRNPNADMWDCQLGAQKGNSGRSAADVAERARDIDACMAARGYQLDTGKPACQQGAVTSTCYLRK